MVHAQHKLDNAKLDVSKVDNEIARAKSRSCLFLQVFVFVSLNLIFLLFMFNQ